MKIKCFRFPCESCLKEEVGNGKIASSSIQVFFRKSGEVSYARARHQGADKKFFYHQQSLSYTIGKLEELGIDPSIGQDGHGESKNGQVCGHQQAVILDNLKSRLETVNSEVQRGVRDCPSLVWGRPAKSVVERPRGFKSHIPRHAPFAN